MLNKPVTLRKNVYFVQDLKPLEFIGEYQEDNLVTCGEVNTL